MDAANWPGTTEDQPATRNSDTTRMITPVEKGFIHQRWAEGGHAGTDPVKGEELK